MNLMEDLVTLVTSMEWSSKDRSLSKAMVLKAIEQGQLETVLERSFKILSSTDLDNTPLPNICRRLAVSMANTLHIPANGDKAVVQAGRMIACWFADVGIVKAIKKDQIKEEDGKTVTQKVWFLEPLMDFVQEKSDDIFCDPRDPYVPWTRPTRYSHGTTIPIVKRADQFGLLHNYTPEEIPRIYNALNRIGNTTWQINMDLFQYANDIDECNSPLPKLPDAKEMERARMTLRNIKATKARRKAASKSLGAFEKRNAFESVMYKAYQYQGHNLNFPHNLCGRSRIYCLSPILHPQGPDIAKAMLELKDKVPMVKRDFFIHTANCAGEDKIGEPDKISWTESNLELLEAIGSDPVKHWSEIQSLGVHKEKKTYYQFIACCIELYKWSKDPEHRTGILLGLDSTSSGNQILAMLSRDHEVASYVNISPGLEDKPGDLYRYVGGFVWEALQVFDITTVTSKLRTYAVELNIKNLAALPKWHKDFRKITKRICMVLPYSGTRYGAGEITQDDQFDHGSDVVEGLNFADCSIVGGIIHDQCRAAARRSMHLMDYMRDNLKTKKALVTWRVPHTNFLAFQCKYETSRTYVEGRVGNVKVHMKIYLPKKVDGELVGNLEQHRNAISPGMVHSLDAAMMTMIINGIPDGIPVSAIHDQFCVPMGHMDDLMSSARDSYKAIADRDKFKDMATSCFGDEVDLPEPGEWKVEDLDKSKYFIC